jgi:uncharacterized membrane protein
MNNWKKISSVFVLCLIQTLLHAQTVVNPDSADMMRSNGKIYVVVGVVVTILLGLFLYVLNLDRKISKLEKSQRP